MCGAEKVSIMPLPIPLIDRCPGISMTTPVAPVVLAF
jgi:hypothetical protein